MNRVYCSSLGDESQPRWEDAPAWQCTSAINGVIGVLRGNTPEQSHESWLAEKKAAGWKYGPVKDPEKKEHPCFVPYAELPPEQKSKDFLFVSTVRAMAESLGIQLAERPVPEVATHRIAGLLGRLEYERMPPTEIADLLVKHWPLLTLPAEGTHDVCTVVGGACIICGK